MEFLEGAIATDHPRRGVTASAARWALGGLAHCYNGGLRAYLAAEKHGFRRRQTLPIPVLSVGNISVGGVGKTPMTQWLCRRLTHSGKRVAILSRGHGGDGSRTRIVADGSGAPPPAPSVVGDEPVLLARTLPGIPVLVGKDRRLSGREALRRFGLDALVLDDGFQYWQLSRDLDLVLLDAKAPFENGWPLPRGLLREPPRGLVRASILMFTRSAGLTQEDRAALVRQVRPYAPRAEMYFSAHAPVGLIEVGRWTGPVMPLMALAGAPVGLISAVAKPESFRRSVELSTGVEIVSVRDWRDHHAFTPAEAEDEITRIRRRGGRAALMTEKDAVKWEALATRCDFPVYALRMEMQVDDEDRFLQAIYSGLFQD